MGWSVLDTAISPDGRHVIYSSWSDYGGYDFIVMIVCRNSVTEVVHSTVHQANIYGEDGQVALPFSRSCGRFCIFALRFSQDGFEILGGANDGNLYLFDRMAGQESLRVSESKTASITKNVLSSV